MCVSHSVITIEHHISTEQTALVNLPPYHNILQAFRKEIHQSLKQILTHGIIEQSTSNWASYMIVVQKKTKVIVSVLILDNLMPFQNHLYPMPHVEELIDRVRNATFTSMLAHHKRLAVTIKDRDKTAFTTLYGLY